MESKVDAEKYIPTEKDSKIMAKFKQQTELATKSSLKNSGLVPSKPNQNIALQHAIKNILYHNRHIYAKDLPPDFFDADEWNPNTTIADDSNFKIDNMGDSSEEIPADFYDSTPSSKTIDTSNTSINIFKRTPNVQLLLQNEMEADLQNFVSEIEKDNPQNLTEEELAKQEELEEQQEQEYFKHKIAYYKNALLQKQSAANSSKTVPTSSIQDNFDTNGDDEDEDIESELAALHDWHSIKKKRN